MGRQIVQAGRQNDSQTKQLFYAPNSSQRVRQTNQSPNETIKRKGSSQVDGRTKRHIYADRQTDLLTILHWSYNQETD